MTMKTTRRDVLRLAALASAAGCVLRLPRTGFAQAHSAGLIYGVQMYMVRQQAPQDLSGVLREIHQVGFSQIELSPLVYTHPAAELKRIVADSGLGMVSGHFDYDGFAAKIPYARQLGLRYMVCPMMPPAQWGSLDGFRQAAEEYNRWGRMVHDAGMEFVLHNLDYEFKPQAGGTGWEVLMQHTDPKLVKLELDIYWLVQAGQDPYAMLTRYSDRVHLLHLKDRTPGAKVNYDIDHSSGTFTELGKGTIAWPRLLEQAKRQGIRYAFMDQDETTIPVYKSLEQNYAYLKRLGL
ncbi:MAG TPA: sugar phosphate isomerase/epimerase [Granulicella sp.]|jgi:sugar phosphate isomerase/epimerase|nr:sugar phosphate isomerase/epimerase [Granulicella sp.]